jgi:hypothetical protein
MAAEIQPPPRLVVSLALTGAALVATALVVIALVQYAGFAMQDELNSKVLTRPSFDLAALRAREAKRLSAYQWVDQKAGVVRIPAERALELTLRDWGRQ